MAKDLPSVHALALLVIVVVGPVAVVKPGAEERVWANLAFYLGWVCTTAVYRVEKFAS